MEFSERLASLIINSKLSHKEIEKITGISAGNISYYRNGKIKPSFDAIIKFAKLFNVSTDYLLLGLDDKETLTFPDLDLDYMTLILKRMLSDPDPDIRPWVRRQFKYAFKDFINEYEEEKKQHESQPNSSDVG